MKRQRHRKPRRPTPNGKPSLATPALYDQVAQMVHDEALPALKHLGLEAHTEQLQNVLAFVVARTIELCTASLKAEMAKPKYASGSGRLCADRSPHPDP